MKTVFPNATAGPCRDCENRTIEPNCHDPERCEKWAEYLKTRDAYREKKTAGWQTRQYCRAKDSKVHDEYINYKKRGK